MQSWNRPTECVFCHFRKQINRTRTSIRYQAIHSKSPVLPNSSNKQQQNSVNVFRKVPLSSNRVPAVEKPGTKHLQLSEADDLGDKVEKVLSRIASSRGSSILSNCLRQIDPDGTLWQDFSEQIPDMIQVDQTRRTSASNYHSLGLIDDLERAGRKLSWRKALEQRLIFAFIDYVLYKEQDSNKYSNAAKFDMKYPTEWYGEARCIQRNIHLHVGPTNSGKTYNALKRLEEAGNGFYAGPLRLLAHEVFTRFNNRGIKCNLITGDDIRLDMEKVDMYASTVEMVDISVSNNVGVIDEIQMIASPDRGFAWTRALLGAKTKELHLCGEARVVPLIRELVASMGDTLHVHKYERLNPLKVMSHSLKGNLKNLRRGDCLVCFSVLNIHALKKQIEMDTGKRVAIVYGSLPPETRAQQAALFNDPTNDYDFLVASDAIGMGLNLSIKRVIFETIQRFNGSFTEKLSVPHLKQIAGRAGRFRTSNDNRMLSNDNKPPNKQGVNIGLVTCLDEADLPYIRHAMSTEAPPIKTAGLLPTVEVYEDCAALLPEGTPFAYVMQHVNRMVSLAPRFSLCDSQDQFAIAGLLDEVPDLSVAQRVLFCSSPARIKGHGTSGYNENSVLLSLARVVAERRVVTVADMETIPLEILDAKMSSDKEYREGLEFLHKALNLYLWLHYRFGQYITDKDMAERAKQLTEERINACLTRYSANPTLYARLKKIKQSWASGSAVLRRQIMADGLTKLSPATEATMNPDASVEEVERRAKLKNENSINDTQPENPDIVGDFLSHELRTNEPDQLRSQS